MDLPITTLTWQQLALGLWLVPLALNLIVYAPRLAAELYADVVRARQGSYTTTSYADVVTALVISSIPLINVIALIFDAFPYALKRFGRFVGFVGDVLSKPIVPVAKKPAPAAEYEETASLDEKTFHTMASRSRNPKIHMVSVPPRGNTKLGEIIDFGVAVCSQFSAGRFTKASPIGSCRTCFSGPRKMSPMPMPVGTSSVSSLAGRTRN